MLTATRSAKPSCSAALTMARLWPYSVPQMWITSGAKLLSQRAKQPSSSGSYRWGSGSENRAYSVRSSSRPWALPPRASRSKEISERLRRSESTWSTHSPPSELPPMAARTAPGIILQSHSTFIVICFLPAWPALWPPAPHCFAAPIQTGGPGSPFGSALPPALTAPASAPPPPPGGFPPQ